MPSGGEGSAFSGLEPNRGRLSRKGGGSRVLQHD